jgi:HlyD family secretion protein
MKEKDGPAVKVVVNGESNDGSEVINDKAKPKEEELKEIVFVLSGENKDKAEIKEVKTGISDFEHIEIISGINEGDEVVSGPFLAVSKTLKNGALVKTEKKRESGKPTDKPKP